MGWKQKHKEIKTVLGKCISGKGGPLYPLAKVGLTEIAIVFKYMFETGFFCVAQLCEQL